MKNFENVPPESIDAESENFQEELQTLRANKEDIYRIARVIQILQARGEQVKPTQEEKQEIIDNLERVRAGKSKRPLAPGYEIARWLMIGKALGIEDITPTKKDRHAIKESLEQYKEEKNFKQLASLIKTMEFLGIPLDVGDLEKEDKKMLDDALQEIE